MVITLGAFDGFHTGHQELLSAAELMAGELKTDWGVVSFEPHPGVFTGKIKSTIFKPVERELLRRFLGIPNLYLIKFDEKLQNLTPVEFLKRLNFYIKIDGIVVGGNFRFGRERSGGTDTLKDFCINKNIKFKILPIANAVSSTKIRGLISQGFISELKNELGYPYFLNSKVIHGNQRGRLIGFPTANLDIHDRAVMLSPAVYAAAVPIFDDEKIIWKTAVVSIGNNPTFGDVHELRFEVYIADFSGDLYDKDIWVVFLEKLRKTEKFANQDDLIAHIRANVEQSIEIFKNFSADLDRFGAAVNDVEKINKNHGAFYNEIISLDDVDLSKKLKIEKEKINHD